MIRDEIKAALVTAMKGGDKAATGTIRLIQSAIKNRDIELRTSSATTDDDLVVAEAYVGKAVKMKRFSARARGRAAPIEKFFSRLTIIVREGDAVKAAPKKAAAKKAAPKKEASEKAAPKKEAAKKPAAKKKAVTKQDKE